MMPGGRSGAPQARLSRVSITVKVWAGHTPAPTQPYLAGVEINLELPHCTEVAWKSGVK